MKRYVVRALHFDTRANTLNTEPTDEWDPLARRLLEENKQRLLTSLKTEFGETNFDAKLQNFCDMGALHFSIISYHNLVIEQCRRAFVIGAYYPALTGVCSLGERILNHLVIDLRDDYKGTPEYKRVYRKNSFDNWDLPINTLVAWNVVDSATAKEFSKLQTIRNKSVHFDPQLYERLREDALRALNSMSEILRVQFGFYDSRWMIKGTKGQFFLKKEAESVPFIRKFYLPQCPLVGYRFAMKFSPQHYWMYFDWTGYESREITDEEFAEMYEARKPTDLVSTDEPLPRDVRRVG